MWYAATPWCVCRLRQDIIEGVAVADQVGVCGWRWHHGLGMSRGLLTVQRGSHRAAAMAASMLLLLLLGSRLHSSHLVRREGSVVDVVVRHDGQYVLMGGAPKL